MKNQSKIGKKEIISIVVAAGILVFFLFLSISFLKGGLF